MDKPQPPEGWRAVTKGEFFDYIGPQDIHPRVRGSYSDHDYGADWINQKTRTIVGYSLWYGEHPSNKKHSAYFLRKEQSS
jgi:hypothetical protein